MSFVLMCTIGYVVSGLFGLGFLLLPEAVGGIYGISGWNPGTLGIGRFFGSALLFTAAAAYAVRPCTDLALQKRFAVAFAGASAIGLLVSLQLVLSGAANAMGWSTVLIYAFFAIAWFMTSRRAT